MNKNVLLPEVQNFIRTHISSDPFKITLGKPIFENVSNKEISEQIISLNKLKGKNPLWAETPGIYFPAPLSCEQSSSDKASRYKITLVQGNSVTDLSGGMGADTYAFASKFDRVTYIERESEIAKIAEHNFHVLNADIKVINSSAEDYLKGGFLNSEVAYVDPARRTGSGSKVFKFEDCEPDLRDILPKIKAKTGQILIKTSPLYDIHKGLTEIGDVSEVHVVSINDDCKEVLFKVSKSKYQDVIINAVDLGKNPYNFKFNQTEEKTARVKYSEPLKYLYLPGASVTKAGAFNFLADSLNLQKIAPNTHIYTSDGLNTEFPGRIFEILEPFKEANLDKTNIIVKNHPLTPELIAKKYKIRTGGDSYLIGFRDKYNKPVLFICKKIKPK